MRVFVTQFARYDILQLFEMYSLGYLLSNILMNNQMSMV